MEMLYEVKERRFEAIKQIRRHNRGFQDFDTTVTQIISVLGYPVRPVSTLIVSEYIESVMKDDLIPLSDALVDDLDSMLAGMDWFKTWATLITKNIYKIIHF